MVERGKQKSSITLGSTVTTTIDHSRNETLTAKFFLSRLAENRVSEGFSEELVFIAFGDGEDHG